jgi:ubiquinone biosynthesis protein
MQHAAMLSSWERGASVGIEHGIQRLADDIPGLMRLFDWGYMALHLGATVAALWWLHRRRPEPAYALLRTALLVASGLGLVGFVLFPTAPPRLASPDIADTVSRAAVNLNSTSLHWLYNPYAAMPSMHVAYATLVGFSVARWGSGRIWPWVGVLYPIWVATEVIATGNHFVVDVAAGLLVAAAALGAAGLLVGAIGPAAETQGAVGSGGRGNRAYDSGAGRVSGLRVGGLMGRGSRVLATVTFALIGAGLSAARRRTRHPRHPGPADGPVRLRRTLERLGPTFVKMGQLVASRPDLVPDGYREELGKLRDHVRPLRPAVVEGLLRRAYGPDLGLVFAAFSSEPIAAASIGQVHRATLRDGMRVAVKIRRPGVERVVSADVALLAVGVRMVDRTVRSWRRFQLPQLIDEFAAALHHELDYGLEAKQASMIAGQVAGLPEVRVPEILGALSGPDVIVMELIDGIPLTDLAAVDAAGLDRHELARAVLTTNLVMILFDDHFHADPHAGNYLALPDGGLGLVDFGQVGSSDQSTRQQLLELLGALVGGDATTAAAAVAAICERPDADLETLSRDLSTLLSGLSKATLGEVPVGRLLRGTLKLLRSNGLVLPANLTLLAKAVLESESTAQELDPGIQISDLVDGLLRPRRPSRLPTLVA